MIRFVSIVLIAFFGSVMLPNEAISSGLKSEKKCCSSKKSKVKTKKCCSSKNGIATNKKCCCKNNKSKNSNDDEGCGGNCDSKSCKCSSSNFNVVIFLTDEQTFPYHSDCLKKNNFPRIEAFASAGFNFIWTPPNLI